MIVVTSPFLAGNRVIESKGMVFGLVVRSRWGVARSTNTPSCWRTLAGRRSTASCRTPR